MDMQFYGANAIRLTTKKATIVIDDNLADIGLKAITKTGDIALFTGPHGAAANDTKIMFDQPGEYEVSDISITGVAARAHIDEPGQHNATMYKIATDDLRIAVVGHIYPELTDDQLEALGTVDILFIPVGGNGYTLDSVGALHLIKEIEPKLVVPTHYADKALNYAVPQQALDEALKGLGMEPKEAVTKLKVKPGELSEVTQLIVIERQ